MINEKYTVERHIATFKHIAEELDGVVRLAVFGFLDIYPKLERNHPEIKDCCDQDKITLAKEFKRIGEEHNMVVRLCSKEKWLRDYGIDVEGCMRMEDYEHALGEKLIAKKKMNARQSFCACFLSNDIGSYNSCPHLCSYCYANGNKNLVLSNIKKHDDDSPFLIGNSMPDDKIHDAKQESWKDGTIALF